MSKLKTAESALEAKKEPSNISTATENLLSSGSTLLNLACSGNPQGCYPKGTYNHFVGDSDSGKSFFALTTFAEAAINPTFKDYRLIYRTAESCLIDLEKFFGPKTAERLEVSRVGTVEEFFDALDDDFNSGKPFIEVLDSEDALTTEDDQEKFDEEKKARENDKTVAGSYGMSKAKKNSRNLSVASNRLKDNGSILIIISQTRANIGFGSQFHPTVYSGGNALKFYASLQLWSSTRSEIKKHYKGKDRQLGITCRVKVTKNHLTGRKGDVEMPLYWSSGIDDLGSCIDYLVEENHWTLQKAGRKEVVNANEFGFIGPVEELIQKIEKDKEQEKLQLLVAGVWRGIEEACKVSRGSKYHV